MLKRSYEGQNHEKISFISSDTSLIAFDFKANSFYKDKIESINELNLNRNIINKKAQDNNITSFIKKIQFRKKDIILLIVKVIIPILLILSDDNKFPSTKLKFSYRVLNIRII